MLSLQARQQLIKKDAFETEFRLLAHPKNPKHHGRVFVNKANAQKAKVSLQTFPNKAYNQLPLDENELEAYLTQREISPDDVANHLHSTFTNQLKQSYAWNDATRHLLNQEHELADETTLAMTLGDRLFAYNALEQVHVDHPATTALNPIYDALASNDFFEGKRVTTNSIGELLDNTQIPEKIETYTPREYLNELALRD